jgi:iron complex transport system ATP-binding protein
LAALAKADRSPPVVLVTHHVEEIPPGFTHMLMLARGRVVAAGRLDDLLTADRLSDAFEMSMQLERSADRWRAWSAID